MKARAYPRWWVEGSLLAAITGLAAALRLSGLSDRGLIYWDEAKFALEGIRLQAAMGFVLGRHVDLVAGKAVGTAKPMHALLIALAYDLFGVHDYSSLYVDAACGVGCVVITFFVGRRLLGPSVALLAAGLLAVSEFEAIYARSALSESDATLFFLAGVTVWLYTVPADAAVAGSAWRGPATAGALFGVAVTTNYRLLVFIAVAVAVDLVLALRGGTVLLAARRLAGWLGGILLAPLVWDLGGAILEAHGLVLFRGEIMRDPQPYWREVLYQLHQGKQSVLHFNPLIYLQWGVLREGWPVSLLIVAGCARALWTRSRPWLIPAALVLVPYGIYIFAPFVVPRNLVPCLPFASILAAGVAVDIGQRLGNPGRILLVAALLAVLGLSAAAAWRLTEVRSGFALAARYVELHNQGRALTSSEIMVFYLRGSGSTCTAPAMPYTAGDLRGYIAQGYRLAVLDRHNNSNLTAIVRRVEPRAVRFPTLGQVRLGESLISSENSNPPGGDTTTEYVNVFYLSTARLPRGHSSRPPICRRDRVV